MVFKLFGADSGIDGMYEHDFTSRKEPFDARAVSEKLVSGFVDISPRFLDFASTSLDESQLYKNNWSDAVSEGVLQASSEGYGDVYGAKAFPIKNKESFFQSIKPIGVLKTTDYDTQMMHALLSPSRLLNRFANLQIPKGIAREAQLDTVVRKYLSASTSEYALLGNLHTVVDHIRNSTQELDTSILYIPKTDSNQQKEMYVWMYQNSKMRMWL